MTEQAIKTLLLEMKRINEFHIALLDSVIEETPNREGMEKVRQTSVKAKEYLISILEGILDIDNRQIALTMEAYGKKQSCDTCPFEHTDCTKIIEKDGTTTCHPEVKGKTIHPAQTVGETTPHAHAIDLGLPSGTLWADRNVGAERPEDTGLYFSWGNTEGHRLRTGCDFFNKEYEKSDGASLEAGIDDAHDAAVANMGEEWKMPTKEDFQELYDNCTYQWDKENGYVGMRFTSIINGNTLFFPAAGLGHGTSLNSAGSYGYYWSRSLHSSAYGYLLSFDSSDVYPQDISNRFYGFSARAVQNLHKQ